MPLSRNDALADDSTWSNSIFHSSNKHTSSTAISDVLASSSTICLTVSPLKLADVSNCPTLTRRTSLKHSRYLLSSKNSTKNSLRECVCTLVYQPFATKYMEEVKNKDESGLESWECHKYSTFILNSINYVNK